MIALSIMLKHRPIGQPRPQHRRLAPMLLVLLLSACASAPPPVPEAAKSTKATGPTPITTAAGRTLQVDGRVVKELPVWPGSTKEVDILCDHKVSEALPGSAQARARLISGCRSLHNAELSKRRSSCGSVRETAAREACMRQGTKFEARMETLRQFDEVPRAADYFTLSGLVPRLRTTDELGLLPAVQARMNALCLGTVPTASSIDGWRRLEGEYALAGPGGACSGLADVARSKADELVRLEQQAMLEKAIARARSELEAATTWRQLAAFIDNHKSNDVAQLLPEARAKLEVARQAELARVRALPLADLESFWNQSAGEPDELREVAQAQLIRDSLKQGSFAGAARAYRVSGDVAHIARSQHLARTPQEKLELEALAVKATLHPAKLVALSFAGRVGAGRQTEQEHAGLFALYSKFGHIPVDGTLTVRRAKDSPVAFRQGRYRVNVTLDLVYTRKFERQSRVLGNTSRSAEEKVQRKASVVIESGSGFTGMAEVSFGQLVAVRLQRGSQGGMEQEWIDNDPMVRMTVDSIEPVSD